MQRLPSRSRMSLVITAAIYAFASFAAVQLVYDWELDRKGLHRAGFQPEKVIRNTFEVHLVGFLVWLAIAELTAFLVQRFQRQLSSALDSTRRQASELSLISEVGAATTGPLPRDRIAHDFLNRIRWAISGCAIAIYSIDEDRQHLRMEAAAGLETSALPGTSILYESLPVATRAQLFDRLEAIVVRSEPDRSVWWSQFAESFPWAADARAIALLPLISRDQPVGAIVLAASDARTLDDERIELLRSLGHFLAGAMANAELVAGAEARATHEQQMNEDLVRLNRAKSDFVSMVAHEFRTPLTGIQGFSEIIRDYELAPDEIRDYANDINVDARRLGRMINAQLDLDRLSSGRMELHREPIDFNALLTDLVDHIAQLSANHDMVMKLEPRLPIIEGDRDRLIQVASNLLNNAVKYSPGGGVIEIATRIDEGDLELSISDHGVGIAPEDVERVFQPYTRVETSAASQVAGTGLGLPIVRQIVELHGGRVWVKSELGHGSTFGVRLPLAPVGAPAE